MRQPHIDVILPLSLPFPLSKNKEIKYLKKKERNSETYQEDIGIVLTRDDGGCYLLTAPVVPSDRLLHKLSGIQR